MTVYTTDFSEYTAGVNLSDWSNYWSSSGITFNAEANSGTYKVGSKQCAIAPSATARHAITWDDIGSVSSSDLIAKFSLPANASDSYRFYTHVSGSASSENSYYLAINYNSIKLGKYVTGTSSNIQIKNCYLSVETNYYVRFQVATGSLKAKLWAENEVEPNDWILDTTDSDLSSGAVGFGTYSLIDDFEIDYFSCGTGGSEPVFPPTTIANEVDEFGYVGATDLTATMSNSCRAMGGLFISENKQLTGITIDHNDTSATIRAAVYSGGTLSNPNGATLLHDFGEISVTASPTIESCSPVNIPNNDPLWIILKSTSFDISDTGNVGNAGDFQIARGRCDLSTDLGYDTTASFLSTLSITSPSFSNFWYPWNISIASKGTNDLDSKLPELDITATGSFAPYADSNLPELSVTAYGGASCNVILPSIGIETPSFILGYLNNNLPILQIEAYEDTSIKLDIDPRTEFQPILSNLKIEAKSGERGSLEERLPDLRIEVKTGSQLDLNIPTLELNASGSGAFSGNVNVNLPTLQLTSYSAGKVDKKLPSLQIESSCSAGDGIGTWTLDKKLPTISISAVSLTNHITADINLPPLSLDSSGSASVIGTVDVNLSTIKITAAMVINVSGEVDAILPELSLTATGYCQSASLDSDLPTLIMSPKGYGDNYDGTDSTITGPSRFDDFTLTYNRWAI